MKIYFLLVILGFSNYDAPYPTFEFTSLQQCMEARQTLIDTTEDQGYTRHALVVACVRRDRE